MRISRNNWLCIIAFVLSLLYGVTIDAQKKIAGVVVNESNNTPIEFVNVTVLQLPDSVIVGGTITDSIGRFSIDKKADMLRFSAIGYCREEFSVAALSDTIHLKPDAIALGEVQVTANQFRKVPGGIVAQVQGSILDKMGTAVDVLKYVPFVNVKNDAIDVAGRGIPLIYINGRLVRDDDEIQQLNSSEIKQVKVITNPGAEYDATVGAVIKITTIKKQGDGLGGFADVRYNYQHAGGVRVSTKLNYRKRGFDVSFMPLTNYSRYAFDQTLSTQNNIIKVDENYATRYCSNELLLAGALNNVFNEKNTAGAEYSYKFIPYNSGINPYHCKNDFVVKKEETGEQSFSLFSDFEAYNIKNHTLNIYYIHKFNDKSDLNFYFDWKKVHHERRQFVDLSTSNGNDDLQTTTATDYSLYAGKFVYNAELAKGDAQIGAEYSYIVDNQTYNVGQTEITNNLKNSDTDLKQHLVAAFASYSHDVGSRVSASVGVRYEHLVYNYYEYDVKDDDAGKIYDGLHPSVSIQYNEDNVQLEFSFRNIIRRPNFSTLRSSVIYDNPYSYEGGNPYLKPQYTNRFSFSAVFGGMVNVVADYNRLKSPLRFITNMLNGSDTIFFSRYENVVNYDYYYFDISFTKKIGVWTPNVELEWYKQNMTYNGVSHNKPISEISVENKFNFTQSIFAGCDLSYKTEGDQEFDRGKEDWDCDMYVIKTFFSGALTTKIQIDNVFNSSEYCRYCDFGNIRTSKTTTEYDRRFVFQLTYKFNQSRSRYKGKSATNEINRL